MNLPCRSILPARAFSLCGVSEQLIDGRLLMTPRADQTPAYYEFEGIGTVTGLLAGIAPHKLASPTGPNRLQTAIDRWFPADQPRRAA